MRVKIALASVTLAIPLACSSKDDRLPKASGLTPGVGCSADGGVPEECFNVLQLFEETDPSHRPNPSCTDVAGWIASSPFDPSAVNLGEYRLESADIDSTYLTGSEVNSRLYAGTLPSFNMVSSEGGSLCSFVATWDTPLKSQWVVETPSRTPVDDTPDAENPCDNGWQDAISQCEAQEEQRLADAEGSIPPRDRTDPRDLVDDYIVPP
jgi:hypothetical protein